MKQRKCGPTSARLGGSSSSAASLVRAPARGEEEIKTKIDLSHISRPGDVLKAITQRKEAVLPPVRPRAVPPACRRAGCRTLRQRNLRRLPPAAVSRPTWLRLRRYTGAVPAARFGDALRAARWFAAARCASCCAASPARIVVSSAAPGAPRRAPPARIGSAAPAPSAVPASAQPAAPVAARPAASIAATAPRMIVPQTGPRPVYKAPPCVRLRRRRCSRECRSAALCVRSGASRSRPTNFSAPSADGRGSAGAPRPPLRPGERRPMHPTRQAPAGARPLGVGPALPPPGPARPGSRPGAPARRPGQRYVPRGVKEGPMKGYTPPPRMVVSNEPHADHAQHHDHGRHQRKRSGGEAGHSRQGSDLAAVGRGRFRHHQPDARRGTGQRDGALLRRRHERHHVRRAGRERH